MDVRIYTRLLHLYFPSEQMEEANKESSVDMSEDEDDSTPSPSQENTNPLPPSGDDGTPPPPLERNQTEPVPSFKGIPGYVFIAQIMYNLVKL